MFELDKQIDSQKIPSIARKKGPKNFLDLQIIL